MRRFTFLVGCLLSTGMAWAEGGESCGSATVITCIPYIDSGNTSDDFNNYDYACPNTSNSADVVYRYTPQVTQTIRWHLCASAYNTKIFIYAGVCSGTPVFCNDDFPFCGISNNGSAVVATMTGGVNYYIVVDGASGAEGPYTLSAEYFVCAPDYVLAPPGLVSGYTCGAANSCNLRPSEDQIVELNVSVAGNYSFSLCNSNPAWNSYMYLTRGCCGGVIAENDNGGCSSAFLSYIGCVYLEACQHHVIIEGSAAGNCGNWTLNVIQHTCFPEYYLYAPGTISGNTCGECSECTLYPSPENVVQVTLPQTGNYTFSFCNGDSANTWNMSASLRSACCGGTLFAHDNGSCDTAPGGSSIMPCVPISGGQVYYLLIEGGSVTECGDWTLTVTPGGADLTLDVPGTISGSTINAGDHCNLYAGFDQIVQLNVPVAGLYTVSLCETAAPGAWDSRLYLSYLSCCNLAGISASNDNGCPPPNSLLSRIDCRYYTAHTYYAIVEGDNAADWIMTVAPCTCEYYEYLQAPGSISGNTCGQQIGCIGLDGEDQDVKINIPWDGQYTFSLCSPNPVSWIPYLAVATLCCTDNFLAMNADPCSTYGYGYIPCLTLARGTYHAIIGPASGVPCGPWTLHVSACTSPAAPDSLVIQAMPPDIHLSWASFGGEVSYNVYRGDTSNFAIAPANLIGTTASSAFVDSGVTVEPELIHFYTVTAETP